MLSDLERRVKILQCLSTSLTKIHSARAPATGGGGRLPRVMKVACALWRRWGQYRAISHTSLVLFRGHFPNKNEAIRTSDSHASWTCCALGFWMVRICKECQAFLAVLVWSASDTGLKCFLGTFCCFFFWIFSSACCPLMCNFGNAVRKSPGLRTTLAGVVVNHRDLVRRWARPNFHFIQLLIQLCAPTHISWEQQILHATLQYKLPR